MGTLLAAWCSVPLAFAGQGTASYLDFDGTNPGFGTPADTSESALVWSTTSAGTNTTTARPSGTQLTIGAVASDFAGSSPFNINLDGGGNLQGVIINSANVNVTFSGTANTHNNSGPNTWAVTNGATLTVNDARQSFDAAGTVKGLNWNNVAVTFKGGGTINFATPLAANCTASNVDSMLSTGVINLQMSPISTLGNYTGGFNLLSGTLNFASAGSANAFNGFAAGKPFLIGGGVVDNTSGGPMTLNIGPGGVSLSGDLTFTGSSSLDFGTAVVTNTASHKIIVNANTLAIGGNISGVNNGITKLGSGTLQLSGANTYSGSTLVLEGALILTNSGSLANSALTVSNSLLDISGVTSSITVPGLSVSNATLVVAESSGSAAVTTPVLNAGGVTNIINITSVPPPVAYPMIVHVIQASTVNGTLNFGLGTLPTTPAFAGYISNNIANNSVDLVITSGPAPVHILTWRGINSGTGLPDGTWDTANTMTWLSGSTPSVFNTADLVTFDDSATGLTVINIPGGVQPSSLTVSNNTQTYTFTGANISDSTFGALRLNKRGTGTLLLQESGDNFSGGINVAGGTVIVDTDSSGITGGTTVGAGATVQIGTNDISGVLPTGAITDNGTLLFNRADNFTFANGIAGNGLVEQFNTNTVTLSGAGSGNWSAIVTNGTIQVANSASLGSLPGGTVTITNGGTLDLGADSVANDINFGAKQILVSGAGVGGNGAIVNNGIANQQNAFQNIVLTSDATFGGPTRWDIRGGSALLDLAGHTLTKTNANQISMVSPKITSGNIVIQQGTLSIEANPNFTNTTGTITVNSGGYIGQFKDIQGFFTRSIVLNGGGTTNLSGSGSVCFLDAPILLTANSTIGSSSGTEYFDNVISDGGGGFGITQVGLGTNYLQATNTYTGVTVVAQGTLGLTNHGSIATSPAIVITNGATFDVSKSAQPFSGATTVVVGDDLNGGGTLVLGGIVATNLGGLALSNANITLSVSNTAIAAINVANLNLGDGGGSASVTITALPATIGLVQFPIIKYSSVSGTFSMFISALPTGFSGNLVNNTANHSIDLQITALPGGVWNGANSAVDDNWSDAANWRGTPLSGNDNLVFTGTAGLNNTNDTASENALSITFAAGDGAFTLYGNPITLAGNVVNSSSNPQAIDLGLSFGTSLTIDGGTAGLTLGGGLTNTLGAPGSTSLTLAGLGTLTNLLNSSTSPGGTNSLITVNGANWTLMDNSSSTPISVPWALNMQGGTLNIGTASSAPNFTSTSAQGIPADNQVATAAGNTATLNIMNGTFTTTARLNTATANTSTGIVNQVGGTVTIASQIQGANGGTTGAQSIINISGGTLNVGTDDGGSFYVASRDGGSLTVSGTASVTCGNLDVSRDAQGNTRGSVGVVNLNGGTLSVGRVGTATANSQAGPPSSGAAPSATFNFNGGTLKANAALTNNPGAFFQGSTATPAIPITTIVKAGGAIIDDGGFAIMIAEPLQHDASLGATADGGLTKNGSGTNTLAAVNTYTGNTTVNAGSLALSSSGSINNSVNIILNGATLDATARADGTLTLASGQTLRTVVTGIVLGNLTNSLGSTVSPGGAGSVGTLTTSGNVALLGTVAMDIIKVGGTAANDQITATGAVAYGGTLNVTLDGGTLSAGDSFQLFNAGSTIGSFAATNLPALGAGLAWNFNAASGTLSVVSTSGVQGFTQPTAITSITLSGADISLNGTNGQSGAAYYLLSSTNVALPLSQWKTVATNVLGAGGNYTFIGTNVVTPGAAHQFFILGNTNLNP